MKKTIYTICLALMTFCIGCDDDDNHLPQVKPESTEPSRMTRETNTLGSAMTVWTG